MLHDQIKKHLYASVCLLGLLISPQGNAGAIHVKMETSALTDTSAQLAFDFIDGDAALNNSVSISGFKTDGSLGIPSTMGGVSGTLPGDVIISDADPFNELLQPIALWNTISFNLNITENNAGGLFPDTFSFFLLDDDALFPLPLYPTTDPSGADALFVVDIAATGNIIIQVFNPQSAGANDPVAGIEIVTIPEPSTFLLMIAGLLVLAAHKTGAMVPVQN